MFEHKQLERIIHLLESIDCRLARIEHHLIPINIQSFTIKENPMALLPIAPGFAPGFTATPVPAGTLPAPGNPVTWSSSDTTNAPVTPNASDPTGLTATVNVPATAVVGTAFTLTVNYTNADGTTATGSASFTIVAAPPADITSFTVSQST